MSQLTDWVTLSYSIVLLPSNSEGVQICEAILDMSAYNTVQDMHARMYAHTHAYIAWRNGKLTDSSSDV